MSWRNSGGSRGSGYRSRNDEGSVFQGGSAGGPSLPLLIGACVVTGAIALALAFAFGFDDSGVPVAAGTAQQGAGGQAGPQAQPAVTAAATVAAAQPTAAPAAGGVPTEALGPAVAEGQGEETVEVGTDAVQQLFAPDALELPANTLVSLTFNNLSTVVKHNWVLVDGGDDVAAAVNDAATAQVAQARVAEAAVPPADTPGLLVAVPILDLGAGYTVTFETPGPGTYRFLCTFPGHYQQGMVGELTVQ